MMNPSNFLDVINYSLLTYEKISAKTMLRGELYIKLYTQKSHELVIKEFQETFNLKELGYTKREPSLIENDLEPGVEFLITFF